MKAALSVSAENSVVAFDLLSLSTFHRLASVAAVLVTLFWSAGVAASTPVHHWSARFGNTNIDEGRAVAVDGSGNVLITGKFIGAVNFGGDNLVSASAVEDIFVAKYNVAGAHQWSKRFGGINWEEGNAIAVDGSGNVLVAGAFFTGPASFGGDPLTNSGRWDVFVAKYNAAGAHQWSRACGSTGDDKAQAVAVDESGNVLVAGYFNGTVSFGGGNRVSAGGDDIFLAKYDAEGTHQWSLSIGGTEDDQAYGVGTDAAGNVWVTGSFADTVTVGGSSLASAGSNDVFLVKYDAAGAHQLSRRFGGGDNDIPYALAVDGSGNVLVTGRHSDTVNFGGDDLTCGLNRNIFLAKYDSTGTHQWSQCMGGSGEDEGRGIAADASGNVYVTGKFQHTVDFGGGDLVSTLASSDIFVAKYDDAGVHQWSQGFGDWQGDIGLAVATDGAGDVLVTGFFALTADFGGEDLVSAGQSDIFLAKFGDVATGVVDAPTVHASSLSAFPNPFNPSVAVRYSVPDIGRVRIVVHDARGSVVTTLVDEYKTAGTYRVDWHGRDDVGERVASGVYFTKLSFGGETRTQKMVLLK